MLDSIYLIREKITQKLHFWRENVKFFPAFTQRDMDTTLFGRH